MRNDWWTEVWPMLWVMGYELSNGLQPIGANAMVWAHCSTILDSYNISYERKSNKNKHRLVLFFKLNNIHSIINGKSRDIHPICNPSATNLQPICNQSATHPNFFDSYNISFERIHKINKKRGLTLPPFKMSFLSILIYNGIVEISRMSREYFKEFLVVRFCDMGCGMNSPLRVCVMRSMHITVVVGLTIRPYSHIPLLL